MPLLPIEVLMSFRTLNLSLKPEVNGDGDDSPADCDLVGMRIQKHYPDNLQTF